MLDTTRIGTLALELIEQLGDDYADTDADVRRWVQIGPLEGARFAMLPHSES